MKLVEWPNNSCQNSQIWKKFMKNLLNFEAIKKCKKTKMRPLIDSLPDFLKNYLNIWNWKLTLKILTLFVSFFFVDLTRLMHKSTLFLWMVQSGLLSKMFLSSSIDRVKNLYTYNKLSVSRQMLQCALEAPAIGWETTYASLDSNSWLDGISGWY